MLDDLKLIHERDAQDALGVASTQWQQLVQDCTVSGSQNFNRIQNVVYAAMGGSALAAALVKDWADVRVPLEIVRDYNLPKYVSEDTLVIVSSYSGNTEETLSALAQAQECNAQIAVITAGGTLQHIAEEKGYLLVELPETHFARSGTFANAKAVLEVLACAGILNRDDFVPQLTAAANFLETASNSWLPNVATAHNLAKQIAQELIGKSVVIYSGPRLYPAAYKWKLDCNENAKQIAWVNQLPEFSHNEYTGWTKQPTDKPYGVVELRSSLEHPQIQKRFAVTGRLLSGMRPEPISVEVEGESVPEQLFWGVMLGDMMSIYLAVLGGTNPTPLEFVDKLKQALTE